MAAGGQRPPNEAVLSTHSRTLAGPFSKTKTLAIGEQARLMHPELDRVFGEDVTGSPIGSPRKHFLRYLARQDSERRVARANRMPPTARKPRTIGD